MQEAKILEVLPSGEAFELRQKLAEASFNLLIANKLKRSQFVMLAYLLTEFLANGYLAFEVRAFDIAKASKVHYKTRDIVRLLRDIARLGLIDLKTYRLKNQVYCKIKFLPLMEFKTPEAKQ